MDDEHRHCKVSNLKRLKMKKLKKKKDNVSFISAFDFVRYTDGQKPKSNAFLRNYKRFLKFKDL